MKMKLKDVTVTASWVMVYTGRIIVIKGMNGGIIEPASHHNGDGPFPTTSRYASCIFQADPGGYFDQSSVVFGNVLYCEE